MKKPHWLLHVLYYTLSLLIYIGFCYGIAFLLRSSGQSDNLGAVIVAAYAVLLVGEPLLAVILIRFSLLRWYVDPFAAAMFPLFLYVAILVDKYERLGSLPAAFAYLHDTLCRDGGEGWLILVVFFLFGLAVSLSFARPKGESISYKLLAKLSHRKKPS